MTLIRVAGVRSLGEVGLCRIKMGHLLDVLGLVSTGVCSQYLCNDGSVCLHFIINTSALVM